MTVSNGDNMEGILNMYFHHCREGIDYPSSKKGCHALIVISVALFRQKPVQMIIIFVNFEYSALKL